MSTAKLVPETWELTGDDAWRTLSQTGRRQLLKEAFMRLRVSDGFSHARSLAFMTSLVLVQGTIVLVGTASALGGTDVSHAIVSAIEHAAPGPAGNVLTQAVHQARHAGASRRYTALALGLVGTLVSSTTAMGQLERALNRIYGVEQDRPAVQKYGLALLLALSAGALVAVSFLALGFGSTVGTSLHNPALNRAWTILRWPVALILIASAMALLFRWCPRRHQPGWSWLAFGSAISITLWFAVTTIMGVVLRASRSFGQTYGPLAGIVALQVWALLSSVAILYGAAVAAQLEATRSGDIEPQDEEKVSQSEPDADATTSRVTERT
ncbi:YihY/virulence factor BrkB family protein [Aquihabitans sp. McL0605]|uniref:YihY/virulence factor BrkB family protein n=1 Tax=Aquihabitans sp. McL0605 TaxID=3415671 RepID=UPI003CFA7FCC